MIKVYLPKSSMFENEYEAFKELFAKSLMFSDEPTSDCLFLAFIIDLSADLRCDKYEYIIKFYLDNILTRQTRIDERNTIMELIKSKDHESNELGAKLLLTSDIIHDFEYIRNNLTLGLFNSAHCLFGNFLKQVYYYIKFSRVYAPIQK